MYYYVVFYSLGIFKSEFAFFLVMEKEYKRLVAGITAFFKRVGVSKAVIGVSGGIDSALCLRLVSDALGAGNVTGLLMPEKGLTKKSNVSDLLILIP